jgi:monoamine oxidase
MSGKRVRLREVKADMRGHTSELLAKALDQGQIDVALSQEDKERLMNYLVGEGYLETPDYVYRGSTARGEGDPYDMGALLQAGFASRVRSIDSGQTRAPVFQPVGGMDQLPKAFARAMPGRITLGAAVQQIRQTEDEVRIVYEDQRTGERKEVAADYVVSCIPLSVLRDIDVNLSPEMMETVRNTNYSGAAKIGLQMRRRFWEEDEGIYGGPSYSNLPLGQFSFPSNGYLTQKGVILGFYGNGTIGGLNERTNPERLEHVLENASRMHPQMREEYENGYCVFWENIRFSNGAYASGGGGGRLEQLSQPDGRIYIGCAARSTSPAWMEGAFAAAWGAVETLHSRAMQE